MNLKPAKHKAGWTIARWVTDYRALDFENPHRGNGKHRARD